MTVTNRCSLLLYQGHEGKCWRCGRPLTSRRKKWCSSDCEDAYWVQHYWGLARTAAMRRDKYKCVKCGAHAQEVNHIEPLVGRGYHSGCVHHLSNLESLCQTCHKIETGLQRQVRRQLANGT